MSDTCGPIEHFGWPRTLYIIHGSDADDRALAEDVARRVGDFLDAKLLTIEEAERAAKRLKRLDGYTLTIFSPAVVADHGLRSRLANLLFLQYQPDLGNIFRHYCVYRGNSLDEMARTAELARVMEEIMVGTADVHLPDVIQELREDVSRDLDDRLRPLIGVGLPLLAVRAVWPWFRSRLQILLMVTFLLSHLTALVLLGMWWFDWLPTWSIALIVICGVGGGYGLNFRQPTDLWPWLGRAWKLPRLHMKTANVPGLFSVAGLVVGITVAALRCDFIMAGLWYVCGVVFQMCIDAWLLGAASGRMHIAKYAAEALDSIDTDSASETSCTVYDLRRAVGCQRGAIMLGACSSLFALAFRVAPAILAGGSELSFVARLIFVPAVVGFLLPVLLSFRATFERHFGDISLTEDLTKRLGPASRPRGYHFPPMDRDLTDMAVFNEIEQVQILQWLYLLRWRQGIRPWGAVPDLLFISYRWSDVDRELAGRIRGSCKASGLDCFLDKTIIRKGDLFRRDIAGPLANCTHFVVVISPDTSSGKVVLREIKAAMQRWGAEMLPPIICVVEPGVAAAMRQDPNVPLEIRFLLTFCPQMTPAEATRPELLRYIVEFTRRQGKIHDWLAFVSPATSLVRAVRLPGVGKE